MKPVRKESNSKSETLNPESRIDADVPEKKGRNADAAVNEEESQDKSKTRFKWVKKALAIAGGVAAVATIPLALLFRRKKKAEGKGVK